jgi:hypothetical protein
MSRNGPEVIFYFFDYINFIVLKNPVLKDWGIFYAWIMVFLCKSLLKLMLWF